MKKEDFKWCSTCKKKYDEKIKFCPKCGNVMQKVSTKNKKVVLISIIISIILVLLPIIDFFYGYGFILDFLAADFSCGDYDFICVIGDIFLFLFKGIILIVIYSCIIIYGIVFSILFFVNNKQNNKILKEIEDSNK